MRTPRVAVLAAIALSVTLLAACTTVVAGTPTTGTVEQRGPKGPVPAGLDRYYGQALTWRDCRPMAYDDDSREAFGSRGVQCALLTVPLDYAAPTGRTITVGVLRKPAAGHRTGALLINPGGPGASGMTAAVMIAGRAKGTPLLDSLDLIGFDPRGIGLSQPHIHCLDDREMDAERARPAARTVAEEEARNKEFADHCAQRSGGAEALGNIGTRDVVRDMDVLRSVLGEEKLTYLGYSYGTRIGTAYAEAFPRNVRAMVLDGAVDPMADPVHESINQSTGFDQAIDAYFKQCAKCAVKSKDELRRLLKPLGTTPLPASDRSLSLDDALTGIAAALYDDQSWPILTQALTELAKGQGKTLMSLADSYYGRDSSGHYTNLMDALVAVRCVDDPRVTDRAEIAAAVKTQTEATRGSFMADADPPLPALDTCAFWQAPNTSRPHKPQVAGVPKLLVISTTGDPATPYQSGVNLAKDLDARLLTFHGTKHTAFLGGSGCVDDIGIAYLLNLDLPAADATC
ncbi:alpha/beta hydrolase [Actinokineospora inagensis]|uniref:alpha/beta hydrolase n=1 Tax=Actinokineospora inagensis TaxID=103730 RepID=UPI0006883731|nr:alpha/beta hydrolase [Actinokineospora inagensis]